MSGHRGSRGRTRSDGELVARVLEGERRAYGVLVDRHQAALHRQARGMGLDPDTAKDMVQETLVKAYASLRSCRKPEKFRSWAFRILRNQCLDHLKDPRRRSVALEDTGPGQAGLASKPTSELRHEIHDALSRLTPLLREAFLLKHEAGYTYDEVAEITDASPSAVKMRVHRAREELRGLLESQAINAM